MKYGLIGEHLGHSYSCEIHAAVADYDYELTELRPDELGGFLSRRAFRAINVTIPYKQAVIPYLDQISDAARRIGAVNTIVNRDGKLCGYNTDYAGMRALAEKLGIQAKGKKVLILGTGGTSRTAYAVARDLGAAEILKVSRKCRDRAVVESSIPESGISFAGSSAAVINITEPGNSFAGSSAAVINITEPGNSFAGSSAAVINITEPGNSFAGGSSDSISVSEATSTSGISAKRACDLEYHGAAVSSAACRIISYEEAVTRHTDAAILINTTPAGMFPDMDGQAVSLAPFTRLEAVLDAVYNPLRTNLVLDAQKRGIPAEGGLYMLAAQGVAASALFLEKAADESSFTLTDPGCSADCGNWKDRGNRKDRENPTDFGALTGIEASKGIDALTNFKAPANSEGLTDLETLTNFKAPADLETLTNFKAPAGPESLTDFAALTGLAYRTVRDQKRNIVLIGMPSSGKTGAGLLLSEKTGLPFTDTDDLIIREAGMPITSFFARYGEGAFRELESRIIAEQARTGGKIIATGGGAVLDRNNVRALKRNGVLAFLDRSPEKLVATSDRPLSSDREALMRRYRERYEIYCGAADCRIPGDGTLEETADLIYRNTI